jgi:hypothetical protein
MGGKMNLNPLKKDDNTDALVKALEDANSAGGNPTDASTQVAAVPPAPDTNLTSQSVDESIIAADPQLNGGDNPLFANDTPAATASTGDNPSGIADSAVSSSDDSTAPASEPVKADELPEGLSSDADAHLPKSSDVSANEDELTEVKNDALQALRPLIEKLDLEPADKFDKYLMMLRASDDPTLIKPAYEAAAAIEGEKEKAQALLDVINEINYITANK